jgi:hypothetical protein
VHALPINRRTDKRNSSMNDFVYEWKGANISLPSQNPALIVGLLAGRHDQFLVDKINEFLNAFQVCSPFHHCCIRTCPFCGYFLLSLFIDCSGPSTQRRY